MSPTKTNIMEKFKLTRKQKGDKFIYTVTDESGNVISTRTSKRDYVACTVSGEFYFGRLDLIGKGDHGKSVSTCRSFIENPGGEREAFIECMKERLSDLYTIAYLSK